MSASVLVFLLCEQQPNFNCRMFSLIDDIENSLELFHMRIITVITRLLHGT